MVFRVFRGSALKLRATKYASKTKSRTTKHTKHHETPRIRTSEFSRGFLRATKSGGEPAFPTCEWEISGVKLITLADWEGGLASALS